MAFNQVVTISNDGTYQLSSNIKKYTLGDLGFIQNNAGGYVLHRALEPDKALNNAIQLKVTINKTLDGFKLSTVSAGDITRVDIFKHQKADALITQYHFFIDELIQRGVLEKLQ